MQSSHKAETVSIVHLMAVEKFGQYFSCWKHPRCLSGKGRRYGGYKCCQLSSKTFRKLNGELYNLWPSIRYFEKLRKQTKWSSEKTGERILGCDVWSDRALMTMTPGDPAKGVIARATLFMSDFYNIPLSEKERILMFSWHTLNPPSQWEKEWARKVSQIEGYQNPYILS
jgi:deoxyribonuclease-1